MKVDGFMFFRGQGTKDNKSFGKIKGETQVDGISQLGGFRVLTFDWSVGAEIESNNDDDDVDDDSDNTDENKPTRVIRPKKAIATQYKFAKVNNFTISKEVDFATPSLFFASANQAVFESATIRFRHTSGSARIGDSDQVRTETFLRFAFNKVVVESWNISSKSGGAGERDQTETISCTFKWCLCSYNPQSVKGAKRIGNVQYYNTDPVEREKGVSAPTNFIVPPEDERDL